MRASSSFVPAIFVLAASCSAVPESDAPVSALLRERGAHVRVRAVSEPDWLVLDPVTRAAITAGIVAGLRAAGYDASPPNERASFVGALTLVPSIELVDVDFYGGLARWDGVAESIEYDDGLVDSKMSRELRKRIKYTGRVSALSLGVRIVDTEGREHYVNAGGIGVLAKRDDHELVELVPAEVVADSERIAAAVDAALRPLYD